MEGNTYMHRATFDAMRDDAYKHIVELSDRKGADYSGTEDALKSFKSNAATLGLNPVQIWSVLALKHWDAVMTYARTGVLESEGIHGRIDDIILYMFLLKGLVLEAEQLASVEKTRSEHSIPTNSDR